MTATGKSIDYRYGQGQEQENDIKGVGNIIDYKYRMHDTRIGRFFAVDPLAAKYPFYSPSSFSGNRVIDMVELEGLEPKAVAYYDINTGECKFTRPVIHLLSLVSGVNESRISEIFLDEMPFHHYPVKDDGTGGALTTYNRISFTDNFFKGKYGATFLGINQWLDLSSHEVKHLDHSDEFGHNTKGRNDYINSFAREYIRYMSHDVPREREADKGQDQYRDFKFFIEYTNGRGTGALSRIFSDNTTSDDQKIEKIDFWWNRFTNMQKRPIVTVGPLKEQKTVITVEPLQVESIEIEP